MSRCCDCFKCPFPVTTVIWGTVIKMKRWSFIVTTSSGTLLLFWRCKRFFKNSHSKYNCTRASLVRISCLFVRHSYLRILWLLARYWCSVWHKSRTKKQFDSRRDSKACPTILNDFLCAGWKVREHSLHRAFSYCSCKHPVLWEWKMNLFSASPIFHQFGQIFVKISIWVF